MTKTEKKAIFVIVLMTLIWGGTFPLVKVILNFLSPINLLMYRFLFAALIALPFFVKGIKKNRKFILKLILLSILLYIAYYTQTVGLKYTTSSKNAFITGLYIIFTPIFALFFIKEKLTLKLSISLLLSIMGLVLLSNLSVTHFKVNIGDLITVISAITFAIQIVLTNIYAKGIKMPGSNGLLLVKKNSSSAKRLSEKNFEDDKKINKLVKEMRKAVYEECAKPVIQQNVFFDLIAPINKIPHFLERKIADRLYANEKCTHCGICETVCPTDNIKVTKEKVIFGNECVLCLRCITQCPMEAIQIGNFTKDTIRWKGPDHNFNAYLLLKGNSE